MEQRSDLHGEPSGHTRPAVISLDHGDHLCGLYETDDEHLQILTGFVLGGLRHNQKVVCIDDKDSAHALRAELLTQGAEDAEKRGQLVFLPSSGAYVHGGAFDPDKTIGLLRAWTEQALAEGYAALRVTGEMSWALGNVRGSEQLSSYEAQVDRFFQDSACIGLCRYDRRAFPPEMLLDALRTHPKALIGTQLYDNFHYMPPDELLGEKPTGSELERWIWALDAFRRSEQATHDTAALLEMAGHTARFGGWRWDLAKNRVAFSDTVAAILDLPFGYSRPATEAFDFIAPAWREDVEKAFIACAEQGVPFDKEMEIITNRGNRRWIRVVAEPVLDDSGTVTALQGATQDITERKQSAQSQLQALEESRFLLDNILTQVWFLSDERTYGAVNKAHAAFIGVPTEDLEFKDIYDILPDEVADICYEANVEIFTSGKPLHTEEWVPNASGEPRLLSILKSPQLRADGSVACLVCSAEDITERKRTEEQVRQRLELLSSVFDEAGIAYNILDAQFRYIEVNALAARNIGQPAEQIVGRTIYEVVPEFAGAIEGSFRKVLETGQADRSITVAGPLPGRSEKTVYWLSHHIPVALPTGETGIAVVAIDITERKHAEEELQRSETVYRTLFEEMPVPLAEADYSQVKREMDALRGAGVTDLEAYLDAQPEVLSTWAQKIRLVSANKDALRHSGAPNEGELEHLTQRPPQGIHAEMLRHVCAELYRGSTRATWSGTAQSPQGKTREVVFHLTVVPGHEERLDRILVAMEDHTEQARAREAARQSYTRLSSLFDKTVASLATMAELRDPYTAGHQQRVAHLARAIGRRMGMDEERALGLHVAASLHDIGKIAIPIELLTKPGRISELEFSLIRGHPVVAHDILAGIDFPWPVAQTVLQHHERLDGSGYPNGLKGDEIMLEGRILAVADVLEAMASHRPYRPALGDEAALEELQSGVGTLYETQVVDACCQLFAEGFTLAKAIDRPSTPKP